MNPKYPYLGASVDGVVSCPQRRWNGDMTLPWAAAKIPVSTVKVLVERSHKTNHNSSAWRQKDLTAYCFKYIDRPFCLQTDELLLSSDGTNGHNRT